MLGGGDLDGDDYNLILDVRNVGRVPDRFKNALFQPQLHPIRTATPGAYTPLPRAKTTEPCTIQDVADFFINFVSCVLRRMPIGAQYERRSSPTYLGLYRFYIFVSQTCPVRVPHVKTASNWPKPLLMRLIFRYVGILITNSDNMMICDDLENGHAC